MPLQSQPGRSQWELSCPFACPGQERDRQFRSLAVVTKRCQPPERTVGLGSFLAPQSAPCVSAVSSRPVIGLDLDGSL